MSKSIIWIVCVLALLLMAPAARANAIGYASATLDWSGLRIGLSEGLTISTLVINNGTAWTAAKTDFRKHDHHEWDQSYGHGFDTALDAGNHDWTYASAGLDNANYAGFGTAQSTTADGVITTFARAGWTDTKRLASKNNEHLAMAQGGTMNLSYYLSGSGAGMLTLSIPYTLSVSCSADPDDKSSASAQVVLYAYSFTKTTTSNPYLSCTDEGTFQSSGWLTAQKSFIPGVSHGPGGLKVVADSQTMAGTHLVPEPSTILLVSFGLFVIIWTRTNKSHQGAQ